MKILALDIWKPIPGYVGYEVSSNGQVRSHWHRITGQGRGATEYRENDGWLLKLHNGHAGHKRVFFGRKSARGWQSVHRLVLLAFIGPCPEGMVCCHNNGIPDDNRLGNLRWDTPSSNTLDSVKHGSHDPGRGETQKHSKLNASLVREIRRTTGVISDAKWAKRIGCSHSRIWQVRQRKAWAHVQ